ncbi:RNA polymerase sigma factor SigJ [Rhodovibrionaceae bacterium A322]
MTDRADATWADQAISQLYSQHQQALKGLAYRMLGSLSDAEDAVQEAFLRLARQDDLTEIRDPRAWLVTTCSRLCLDKLKSAQHKREVYPGTWLPEPLASQEAQGMILTSVVGQGTDPEARLALAESLSMAFLTLLERLNPLERAAYLLHDLFDQSYEALSELLDKPQGTCRQLVSRARQKLGQSEPRFQITPQEEQRLATAFFDSLQQGDAEGLQSLLAEDAELWSDAGGKARAAINVIRSAAHLTAFFLGITRKFSDGAMTEPCSLNGAPGFLSREEGRVVTAVLFDFARDGRISRIYMLRNPDKLALLDQRFPAQEQGA